MCRRTWCRRWPGTRRSSRARSGGPAPHGRATTEEVSARVDLLRDAPLVRVPTRQLLEAALPLAAALSGYDAVYMALARAVRGTLVTVDERLARTAHRQFGVRVRTPG
ncbi:MAG TPA: PIN domain-containing protein [Actinomycetales bacterium]|nr:PIN domain-containing protein [Actinomycetales bacterium]